MNSVVIPTRNRAKSLRSTLESLVQQDLGEPYEVIVVDNSSTDATVEVVQEFAQRTGGVVRYVVEGIVGLSRARNAGIAAACGEIVVFTDDDVIPDRSWLRMLVSTYREHPDAWVVGGPVNLELPDPLPRWFTIDPPYDMSYVLGRFSLGPDTLRLEYPQLVVGGNMSLNRPLVSRIGFFNTELGRGTRRFQGEDPELCYRVYRAGGSVYYCGGAVVTHVIPESRITKHHVRATAYWNGRLVGELTLDTVSKSRLVSEVMLALKDTAKAAIAYITARSVQGFQSEISVRNRVGLLIQALLMRFR